MAAPVRVLGIVLAGGEGKRLWPLTADRAKPAVPFGGNYRLIDFVLSNMVNAGFLRICVLTQYKSHSLDRHITQTWRMSTVLGNYITPVPAQQRLGPRWYTGSADAILQSMNLITDDRPDHIVVFGADHVYRMDPKQMLDQHVDSGAGVTVAGIRVPRESADQFGVIDASADGRVLQFLEKPADPPGLPDDPGCSFASMGNYIFTTEALVEALRADAEDPTSVHDMGGSIMPWMVKRDQAWVYDFSHNDVPGSEDRDRGYWRDVGTIDAYYDANMDLVSVHPIFNLYNQAWPIYTHHQQLPPAKFVDGGLAQESIVGRRRDHLRIDRAEQRALAERQDPQRRLRRGLGDHGQRGDRRGRGGPAGHPGQERGGRARRAHRGGSGYRPRSAITSRPAAWWCWARPSVPADRRVGWDARSGGRRLARPRSAGR